MESPAPSYPESETSRTSTSAHVSPGQTSRGGLWVLLAGLLAGGVSFLAGEWNHERFQPSLEASSQAYDFQELNRQRKISETRNGMVVFGTLGGCLGLAMGIAGGLSGGRRRAPLVGGLVGLVLGAAAAVAASAVLIPIDFERRDPATTDLTLPLMVHGGIWVLLALGAGLGFGIGRGGLGSAVRFGVGAALGALFGTFVYELVGGVAFPLARTIQPISAEWTTRLLAHGSVAVLAAAGILFFGREGSRKAKAAS